MEHSRYVLTWLLPAAVRKVAEISRPTPAGMMPRPIIAVVRNDETLTRIRMRYIATTEEAGEPLILVSDEFLNFPRPEREAALWHEVGHIHHGHISY